MIFVYIEKQPEDMKTKKELREEKKKATEIYVVIVSVIILLMRLLEKMITALSYVFPFNYLLENNRFHYSRRAFMEAWDEIIETSYKLKTHYDIKRVEENDYFYCYVGKFGKRVSEERINKYMAMLEQKYRKGNVFLRKSFDELDSINIIKEAVV